MPIFIDQKYVNLASNHLPLFKWQGDSANFRCPLCGDSKKNPTKKRGYLYPYNDGYNFKCHNCAASMTFGNFLKEIDPMLFKEYIADAFKFNNEHRWHDKHVNDREQRMQEVQDKLNATTEALDTLIKVSELDNDHFCKQYIRNRKIPFKHWNDLYYCENYQKWIHDYVDTTKFEHPPKFDPRVVIPFRNRKNKVFAYQGRAIPHKQVNNPIRYITINPNDSVLVWGLDKIDPRKTYWAFEGPIDAMYIDNTVAAAGASLLKFLKMKNRPIFVFDNEPRAKEICAIMQDVIEDGGQIVIWPKDLEEKDVGEMIENGMTSKEILDIMQNNVYSGLQAKLTFKHWKIV